MEKLEFDSTEELWEKGRFNGTNKEDRIRFCYSVCAMGALSMTLKDRQVWYQRGLSVVRFSRYSGPKHIMKMLASMAWEMHMIQHQIGSAHMADYYVEVAAKYGHKSAQFEYPPQEELGGCCA